MQNQTYQFDGDLFVILDVSSVVDVTKRTASEFAAQSVFSSDPQFHFQFDLTLTLCEVSKAVVIIFIDYNLETGSKVKLSP